MYYFAYGSNMNTNDLHNWCRKRGYRPIQFLSERWALLNGHKLVFDHFSTTRKSWTANIDTCRDEHVEGVLFELSEDDLSIICEKEGPHYKKFEPDVPLMLCDGREIHDYVTYKADCDCKSKKKEPQAPTSEYMQIAIKGANAFSLLSEEWICKLKSVKTVD